MAGNGRQRTNDNLAFVCICYHFLYVLPVVLHMVATKRPSTCLTGRMATLYILIGFFRLYQVGTDQGELSGLVSAMAIPILIDFSNMQNHANHVKKDVKNTSSIHQASAHRCTHAHMHARTAQKRSKQSNTEAVERYVYVNLGTRLLL